jgi:hypothetical protein
MEGGRHEIWLQILVLLLVVVSIGEKSVSLSVSQASLYNEASEA